MMLTQEQKNMQQKMTELDRIMKATELLQEASMLEFEAHCVMVNHVQQEIVREKMKTQVDIICDARVEFQATLRKLTRSMQDGF